MISDRMDNNNMATTFGRHFEIFTPENWKNEILEI